MTRSTSSSSFSTAIAAPTSSRSSRPSPTVSREIDSRNRTTSNQRGSAAADASRRPISTRQSSTASSSSTTRPRHSRSRTRSRVGTPARPQSIIVQLLVGLLSALPPSAEVLTLLRRHVNSIDRVLSQETRSARKPPAQFYCPCCRVIHHDKNCEALAHVSPCQHCGDGH